MHKSIFYKFFRVCATVLLSSVVVLGLLFLLLAGDYFKEERRSDMKQQVSIAQSIIMASAEMDADSSRVTINSSTLSSAFQTIALIDESAIYFTDVSGNVQLYCDRGEFVSTAGTVSERVLNIIGEEGIFFEAGKLDGFYPESYYTYGTVVYLNGKPIGNVFIAEPSSNQTHFLIEIIKIFALSSIAALVLAVMVTYYSTNKLVRPLREMSAAAKRFGQGDFTFRIEVTSDDEIGQLALALNNMAESLSQQEGVRRSFIANVSHELKTPMTSIGGFIDGILDGTIPQSEHRKYLRIVSEETQRLARLVRSMLNLSRIEAGELKLNRTQFNIVETIAQTLFTFEQKIDEKALDIRGLDTDKVIIEADNDLTHQVVYNLIENAVKFVNQNGYLAFNFYTEGGMTYIGIRNSGDGLSKEEIPRVFDRFYKTDRSRGIDKNGVGLGLHLVKSIVGLHGGDIMVRSVQGEYTEFVFSIPAIRQKPAVIVTGKEKAYAGGVNSSGLVPVLEAEDTPEEQAENYGTAGKE